MTITVRLFARTRELAGAESVALALPPGATVADLRRGLAARIVGSDALIRVSAIAVNHDFADESRVLSERDEIALIPPVSGG